MTRHRLLIGRERERAELERALAGVREGRGGLVLLAGEAGIGKTHLAEVALSESGLLVVTGAAMQEGAAPYGPIVAALRSFLQAVPGGLSNCGPLAGYLALLLPELGPAIEGGTRSTLFEAIRCAFAAIARHGPAAVFLDDLHWADNATLELLPALAGSFEAAPLLIVGAYRSDEVPRGHPVRRMRIDLRRGGRLREVTIDPLDPAETAALAARICDGPPTAPLAAAIYDRTQGVPFFIEELAAALAASGRLRQSEAGVEMAAGEEVPLPETVRDAVLLRADGLSEPARSVLEVAAVAGLRFDLGLVAELAGGEDGFEEPIERGLLVEVERGRGAFRHAFTREALYGEITWTRRGALHRQIAAYLEAHGAPAAQIAEHWLAGRESLRARRALLVSAYTSGAVHAYRDAAQAIQRALELWPEGTDGADGADRADEADRLDALDRLAQYAELSGDLAEAARAWREVAEGLRRSGEDRRVAEIERRLATVYKLQDAGKAALAARQAAAETFAACGLPGEAAAERLIVGGHLQATGSPREALDVVLRAAAEADRADRHDLKARALGLEGTIRGKLGQIEAGLEAARAGLALALEKELTGPAAENYQHLASVLENASDYRRAKDAYLTAVDFCQTQGLPATAQACLGCLAHILRQTGEWDRALALCRQILASGEAPPFARTVANCMLGTMLALRGEAARARPYLTEGAAVALRNKFTPPDVESAWGLALVDELDGALDAAAKRYRFVIERSEQTGDTHYAIPALRWAVSFFAAQGAAADARAGAKALAAMAAANGSGEALAGLAHALGETALLDGAAAQAARQFGQALDLLRDLDVPFERAQTQFRAGLALTAAGERDSAVERLTEACRAARRLGMRPLAGQAARALADLGEPVERRLGRRAAGQLAQGGLSRRELEVLRLVAVGRTNREIGQELFLSPRTVDMHVRNILAKLGCRTRAEAAHKAGELGLTASRQPSGVGEQSGGAR